MNNELDTTVNLNEQVSVEPQVEALNEPEVVEIIPSMEEFSDLLNKSFKKQYTGDLVTCTIISVTDTELLVNMGYISDGIIPVQETFATEEMPIKSLYHEGDVIKAEVTRMDDGDGNVLLSVKKAEAIVVWEDLAAYAAENKTFSVRIKEVVKGGVISDIRGVRAFIPASQLSLRYVEDLSQFVGQDVQVKITTFSKEDKKVVLSKRLVDEAERVIQKNKLFAEIKKNDRFTGTVVKLMNFGAFVDIGGVQGLIHNQELSWSRIKHPSEIVKEGDVVEVYVIDVDTKNEKIGLGLKDIKANPWDDAIKGVQVGHLYKGTVERLATYGAFVKIGDGMEGLVHISEISDKRIAKPQDVLAVGDEVQVKVLEVDLKEKRIKLSIKEAVDQADHEAMEQYATTEQATTSLEDVFKVFLKDIKN